MQGLDTSDVESCECFSNTPLSLMCTVSKISTEPKSPRMHQDSDL